MCVYFLKTSLFTYLHPTDLLTKHLHMCVICDSLNKLTLTAPTYSVILHSADDSQIYLSEDVHRKVHHYGYGSAFTWCVSINDRIVKIKIRKRHLLNGNAAISKRLPFFDKKLLLQDEVTFTATSKYMYSIKLQWKHFFCITWVTWATIAFYDWQKRQKENTGSSRRMHYAKR